jgi:hypothetical protein
MVNEARYTPTRGTVVTQRETTRHDLANDMVLRGLNATRIADALYKDAVQNVPFIGQTWHAMLAPLNMWTFDKVTLG